MTRVFYSASVVRTFLCLELSIMVSHLLFLPKTIIICSVLLVVWQQVCWSQQKALSKWVTGTLGLLLVALVYYSFQTIVGLEASVSLLFLAFYLKCLEIKQDHALYKVILLGLFLTTTPFLFDQSLWMGVFLVSNLIWLTSCMVKLVLPAQQLDDRSFISQRALKYLIYALPLALLIFVFFPRISPFWKMPVPDSSSAIGLSETLSPGEMVKLGKSGDKAFRVQFSTNTSVNKQDMTKRLDQSNLYWRVMTLSLFDGERWRKDQERLDRRANQPTLMSNAMSIELMLMPTQKKWFPTLGVIDSAIPAIAAFQDQTYQTLHSVIKPTSFQVTMDQRLAYEQATLGDYDHDRFTYLPDFGNSRSRDLAKKLRYNSKTGQAVSDVDYLNRVIRFYQSEPFHYSLTAPEVNQDQVDYFLLDHQKGFCGHFASSFVYLMRAGGVPARIVVGYQGGEWNEVDGLLTVHQFDAHAWAEVWIKNKWIRIDPTGYVAPDRIEKSARDLFSKNEEGWSEQVSSLGSMLFNWQAYVDMMEYKWQKWVVRYDNKNQKKIVEKTGEWLAQYALIVICILGLLAVISLLVWRIYLKPKQVVSPQSLFIDLCKAVYLELGVKAKPQETPLQFSHRVELESQKSFRVLKAFSKSYNQAMYAEACNFSRASQQGSRLKRLAVEAHQEIKSSVSSGLKS